MTAASGNYVTVDTSGGKAAAVAPTRRSGTAGPGCSVTYQCRVGHVEDLPGSGGPGPAEVVAPLIGPATQRLVGYHHA